MQDGSPALPVFLLETLNHMEMVTISNDTNNFHIELYWIYLYIYIYIYIYLIFFVFSGEDQYIALLPVLLIVLLHVSAERKYTSRPFEEFQVLTCVSSLSVGGEKQSRWLRLALKMALTSGYELKRGNRLTWPRSGRRVSMFIQWVWNKSHILQTCEADTFFLVLIIVRHIKNKTKQKNPTDNT